MERRPRSAPAARRVAPIPNKRPGSAHAWTEAKRRDAKREELLALIEGCGVEPVLEAASQKVLKTDPTRAKAALKKLDFAAHAARCGLQKGQPAAAQAALKTIEARATMLNRTVTAMADERDHFKFVSEELERRLLGCMKSKQSQIEALSMRVKHDRDALLSTLNSLRERNELLEEQVERLEIDLAGTRARLNERDRRHYYKDIGGGTIPYVVHARANYEYGCELREAPWSADAEKHKAATERARAPETAASRKAALDNGACLLVKQDAATNTEGASVETAALRRSLMVLSSLSREANLWPRKVVREALLVASQSGVEPRARALALDCLIRLAGYEANKRRFWAHRPLRRLLYATAFERLAPGPLETRAKERLLTLLPDATLLSKLGPLAATLARRARAKADADAAAPLGEFAGLMTGAKVVLDQKALGDALDLVAAGGLPGRDAGTRYAVIETLYLLSQPPPLRRHVWVHRGARHALLAAVDHAPDFDTKDKALQAVASLLLQNQNQAEIYKDDDFVRVLTGDPVLELLVPPDMRDDASAPVPAPRSPTTLAEAIHDDMTSKGYTRVDPLPPPTPDPREAVLAKAQRVRDRAAKAGDRAEEASRAMLRAESLAAADAAANAAERLAADNSCRSPRIAPTLVDGRRTGAERLAEARAMREEAVRREKGRAEPPFRIPRDLLVYLGA